MKIPLAGFEVSVEVVDLENQGECVDDGFAIRLRKTLTPDRRLETFLHEYLHSIELIMGLDLKEHEVQTMGVLLHQGLNDYLGELKSHLAAL